MTRLEKKRNTERCSKAGNASTAKGRYIFSTLPAKNARTHARFSRFHYACYNPPYIFPGSHSPDPVTIHLPDKPPVLKDQPPIIFPSATPPDLISKQPLPMNPPLVEDLPPCADMPCPMSTEPLPEPLVLEPPVEPLVPIPWNIHHRQYLSMEEFVKHVMQNPVS